MHQKNIFLFLLVTITALQLRAQQITGIWEGRINNNKVEVKIIQNGDSLTGTSYYYSGNSNYRRYTIKGYFDQETNEVVWWDDQLITDKAGRNPFSKGHVPLVSRADFNCPGGSRMMLEGKSSQENKPGGKVYLEKSYNSPLFPDEWDFVIENYTVGGNDPYIIDSIGLIAFTPMPKPQPPIAFEERPVIPEISTQREEAEPLPRVTLPAKPVTIEEKFTIRKKVFTAEIPIDSDSLELRFFDNVQVDGDSITLFLNEKMIFTHIRLTEKPFVIKLAASDLNESNELTMVAENLGAIPPNTAYMVAIVGEKRYDINLSSTEETSGMIRLKKPAP